MEIRDLTTEEKREIEFHLPLGLLPKGGLMFIVGEPGVGKTFFALRIAIDLASGEPLFGIFPLKQKKVLFVSLEMRGPLFWERFKLFKNREKVQKGQAYVWEEKFLNLLRSDTFETFKSHIFLTSSQVVIVDTFSQLLMDETKQEWVKVVLDRIGSLRSQGISFIMVHHLRKTINPRTGERVETVLDHMSGLKLLVYEADSVVSIEFPQEREMFWTDSEKRGVRVLKGRYSPIRIEIPIWLNFNIENREIFEVSPLLSQFVQELYRGKSRILDLELDGKEPMKALEEARVRNLLSSGIIKYKREDGTLWIKGGII